MRPQLALFTLVLVLVACGGNFNVSTANIRSATLAKGYENDAAVNPTTMFSPTDHTFHLVVDVANAPADTKVGATWFLVNAPSNPKQQLGSNEVMLAGDQNIAHFTLANNQNWPTGQYTVEITLNGKADRTLEFQVK